MKIKKDYNTKIVSILVAITFLLNSTVYGIDLPRKAHLRIPLAGNSLDGKRRLQDGMTAIKRKFSFGLLTTLVILPVLLQLGDKPTEQTSVVNKTSVSQILDRSIIEQLLHDRKFNLSLQADMFGISENNKDEFALIRLPQALNAIDNLGVLSRDAVPVAVIDLSPQGEFSSTLSHKMVLSKHGSAMADIVHQIGGDKIDVWTISAGTKHDNGDLDMSYLGQAVDFAAQEGAKVIILSISGQGDQTASQAIDDALKAGVCITEAVGNDGVQDMGILPSYDKRILRVGGVKSNGERAEESNYGVTLEGLQVANVYAPDRLYVTYPDGKQDIVIGSSFASPVVGAVAGLLFGMDSQGVIDGYKITEILKKTSQRHGSDLLPIVDVEAAVKKMKTITIEGRSSEIPNSLDATLKARKQTEKTTNTDL